MSLLAAWPLPRWPGWVEHVNRPQTEAELAALCRCAERGSPFAKRAWCDQIVRRLGLESTLAPKAAPKIAKTAVTFYFPTPRSRSAKNINLDEPWWWQKR